MEATMTREFEAFPKISRLNREVVVSEKIDGTNAAVVVTGEGDVYAQSRTRIITPDADNMGFARWVEENKDALREQLGIGRHFGEWWGSGIQRRYGLDHKRFSLFNLSRWHGSPTDDWKCIEAPLCYVVPTVGILPSFDTNAVNDCIRLLAEKGSLAAPGFMDPEGVVAYHGHSNSLFKVTIKDDEKGKNYGA